MPQSEYMALTGGRVVLNLTGADKMKHVEPGDVISHLRSFQGGLETSAVRGKVSQAYTVVSPRPGIHSGYFRHLFKSDRYIQALRVTTNQLRDGQSIRLNELRKVPLPLPPYAEQVAIADYLDRETAQIDALIEKQHALIDRLRERRQLTVFRLALGQENTQEEGDAWYLSPPAHWAIDKLGRHALIRNGSTPRRDEHRYWAEGHHPWLNSSFVNLDEVVEADQFVTDAALEECHLPMLAPGAVLIGITGQGKTRGMAALLQMRATINQHVAAVIPDESYWDSRYLTHLMRAAYGELRFMSDEGGSTRGAITCADLHAFRVPRPPLDEQRDISRRIDQETARTDALMAKAERFIELARERRSALITAAVTGQIDVENARAA